MAACFCVLYVSTDLVGGPVWRRRIAPRVAWWWPLAWVGLAPGAVEAEVKRDLPATVPRVGSSRGRGRLRSASLAECAPGQRSGPKTRVNPHSCSRTRRSKSLSLHV